MIKLAAPVVGLRRRVALSGCVVTLHHSWLLNELPNSPTAWW